MRASSEEVLKQLLRTNYIDSELKDLSYNHLTHTVTLKYGYSSSNNNDYIVLFKDCFSTNINIWLEGMETVGGTLEKPSDLGFFFHNIDLEDIQINGVNLYKCSMLIPMMDCQITCGSIEIKATFLN